MIDNHFNPVWVNSSNQLESIVSSNIQNEEEKSYYLFINSWDGPCNLLRKKLALNSKLGSQKNVYVIDIFDVPNGLNIIKSCIKESKETISTLSINNYTRIPMMVRLHKNFPVLVDNNGQIFSELGL